MDLIYVEITPGGSNDENKIVELTEEKIKNIVDNIDWNRFHVISLGNAEQWVDVSGSINDGLAWTYCERKGEDLYFSEKFPENTAEIKEFLLSHFNNDDNFLAKYELSKSERLQRPGILDGRQSIVREVDPIKYKKWKERFEEGRRKQKSIFIKRAVLAVLVLIVSTITAYYGYKGDLKFFGQRTEMTKAEIIKTQMHHIGNGYYMQTVVYEFEYEGEKYLGSFEAGKYLGMQEVGGLVKVKFALNNPNRSRMVSVYKKQNKGLIYSKFKRNE